MSDFNIKSLLDTRTLLPEEQKKKLQKEDFDPNKVNVFFVAKKTEKPLFLNGCIGCNYGVDFISMHLFEHIKN